MNKINKIANFLFFIICLIFIIFILLGEVNAETCNSTYITQLEGYNKNETILKGSNWKPISFNNNQWLNLNQNFEYFILDLNYYIITDTLYETGNIDFYETCSHTSDQITGYTIHYNDGTTASVSANTWQKLCDTHTIDGSYTHDRKLDPNIAKVNLFMNLGNHGTSNNFVKCENIGNYNYKCPSKGYSKISGFIFSIILEKSPSANVYYGIETFIKYCNSDSTQIINNQNQNTQQIVQQQQNINNSITSDDVSDNNSNSSITTIGNTFNSQGDFLLNLLTIPYNLWTSILNAISGSCSPIDVGTIFGEHLIFPCINLNGFLGDVWTTIVDVIFTGIIYSAFIRRVIKYFRELLTLDSNALVTGGVNIW